MRRNSLKKNLFFVIILVIIILSMSLGYAILSSRINANFGSITQHPLTFDVGFYGDSVSGTSNISNFSCGAALVTSNEVSLDNVEIFKSHVCTYQLSIKNFGTTSTKISAITNNYPSGYSSSQCSGSPANFTCNLTNSYTINYKLCLEPSCVNLVPTGSGGNAFTISPNLLKRVYLKVSVNGTVDTEKNLTGGGFRITFTSI